MSFGSSGPERSFSGSPSARATGYSGRRPPRGGDRASCGSARSPCSSRPCSIPRWPATPSRPASPSSRASCGWPRGRACGAPSTRSCTLPRWAGRAGLSPPRPPSPRPFSDACRAPTIARSSSAWATRSSSGRWPSLCSADARARPSSGRNGSSWPGPFSSSPRWRISSCRGASGAPWPRASWCRPCLSIGTCGTGSSSRHLPPTRGPGAPSTLP